MARIVGVDLPREKRIDVGLTYIYGIGKTTAMEIIEALKLDPSKRVKDLNDAEVSSIANYIQNNNLFVEGDLRRTNQQNIKRLMEIGCYRGTRHIRGLPVRGQRTHTNARTRKGKRAGIGAKKK
jgi:small subunit ribosomal protein S13